MGGMGGMGGGQGKQEFQPTGSGMGMKKKWMKLMSRCWCSLWWMWKLYSKYYSLVNNIYNIEKKIEEST
jgi:hypothetical protein